jgi:hypothetical protein
VPTYPLACPLCFDGLAKGTLFLLDNTYTYTSERTNGELDFVLDSCSSLFLLFLSRLLDACVVA